MFSNTASDPAEENGGYLPTGHNASASKSEPANGSSSKAPSGLASAEKAKSAAAEIAIPQVITKPDPVGDAIKKCNAVAKGNSVFKASVAHIFEGLKEAYPTFKLTKNDKAAHQRVIDELMAKYDYQRTPSLNAPANNATVLACHPASPEEHSNCSDWANVLVRADFENVSINDFPAWVQDKKIGESKRMVRAHKQAKKPLKTPFVEGDFPALAFVFKRCDDERVRDLLKDELKNLNDKLEMTLASMDIVVA